jgi:serine phosphatase RsbU (regulator of sigma subunit)/anti-anti-sigma regulatory factor
MNPDDNIPDPEFDPLKGDEAFLSSFYSFPDGDIEIHTKQGLTVFLVRGKFTTNLFQQVSRLLARTKGTLGLDLRKLTGLNLSIVGLLENLARKLRNSGGDLVVLNPDDRLMDLLKLSGSKTTFKTAVVELDLPSARKSHTQIFRVRPGSASTPARREKTGMLVSEDKRNATRIAHFKHDLTKITSFERTLDQAEKRQKMLLPSDVPHIDGYYFAAEYNPSEKVGGDFYDFILYDENTLGIVIGDVSGHGMLAAMYMGMLKMVIRIRAAEYSSPAELLKQVNRDLVPYIDRNSFITIFYALLDARSGILTFARAGHTYPVLFNPATGMGPQELQSPGILVGIEDLERFESSLRESSIHLGGDDMLLLYTDGLVEARSPAGEEFGTEGLFNAIKTAGDVGPGPMLRYLLREINGFAGSGRFEDDVLMLCMRKRP